MKLTVTDWFCGAGGTSVGAHMTGGVEVREAVNHWRVAIDTHSANFRDTRHRCTSIDNIQPGDCERTNIFFASPECTGFTEARGKRKPSASSRCLAWQTLPWIEYHRPDVFVFENVVEFLKWGPLNRHGKPDRARFGETFRSWIKALQSYGYTVEWRVLNSADYGAATSRERLFVYGRLGRKSPLWPEPTHTNHVPFVTVLDRSLPLTGVAGRAKPLCPNTMTALHRGRELLGDSTWIHAYYGNSTITSVTRPLPTITTKDRFALVDASSGEFATRMLSNRELALAQGFPADYVFCGNKKEVTKQIGNSVPPAFSRAFTEAILSM